MVDDSLDDRNAFSSLLALAKAGDQAAATTLVEKYSTTIQRIIRIRMVDPRLRSEVDSIDLCQSVLAGFFVRLGAGELDISSPEDLVRLLTQMARNRVATQARRASAARRDVRRTYSTDDDGAVPGADPSPSRVVVARDLLAAFQAKLSDEGRQISAWRADGWDWPKIGEALGLSADAARKRFSREVQAVSRELDLGSVILGS